MINNLRQLCHLRRISHGLVVVLALFVPTSSTFAQTSKGKAKSKTATRARTGKDVVSKTLTGNTGWPINFTYYSSPVGDEAPVLLLLHGKSGNQLIWDKSAETFRKSGYAVVTVDLRKHGKSLPEGMDEPKKLNANDYRLMAREDLEVVKNFLMQEHHDKKLNIRKLGIVAMGMSAPVALTFAANDWLKTPYSDGATLASRTPRGQDVRAIAMLSPESSVAGLTTTKPLMVLRDPLLNVAMLFVAGTADKSAKRNAEKMHKQVAGNPKNAKRMQLLARKDKINGAVLLSDRYRKLTETALIKFFDDNLKSLESPWRSRKSKLTN